MAFPEINSTRYPQTTGTTSTSSTPQNGGSVDKGADGAGLDLSKKTKYTVQPGDTPIVIAKKLGFEGQAAKQFAEILKQQLQADGSLDSRGWLKVSQQINIPGEWADKLNEMSKNGDYTTDYQALNEKFSQTDYAKKTAVSAETNKTAATKASVPENIQTRADEINKNNGTCKIVGDTQSGFTIVQTDGPYLQKNGINQIQLKYDKDGNFVGQYQTYANGKVVNGTMVDGKMQWKQVMAPAHENAQKTAETIKSAGGKSTIIGDPKTGSYGVKYTEGKNFEKLGLTEIIMDYDEDGNLKSSTKTHTNGQVVKYNYEKYTAKDGQIKVRVAGREILHEGTTAPKEDKLKTAVPLEFNYPNAPKPLKTFAKSLCDNKADLMKELKLDNDEYNKLANLSIGLTKPETEFGESKKYDIKEALPGGVKLLKWMKGDDSANSRGLTQIKFNDHIKNPEIKAQMAKFGITKEDDLNDPDKSAIATIILLNSMNKELKSSRNQTGIGAAQGMPTEYSGWEKKDGVLTKTGNTQGFNNEISQEDALCYLWNGRTKTMQRGDATPDALEYVRTVRSAMNTYQLTENKTERTKIETEIQAEKAQKARVGQTDNSGGIGSITYLPRIYTNNQENTAQEKNILQSSLSQNSNIKLETKEKILNAINNGEFAFAYGLRKEEADSLSEEDCQILLSHLEKLKSNIQNYDSTINFDDGISTAKAGKLRNTYLNQIKEAENEFKNEYLQNHTASLRKESVKASEVLNTTASGRVINEQIDSNRKTTVIDAHRRGAGSADAARARAEARTRNGEKSGFASVKDLGVNPYTSNGTKVSEENRVLAEYASAVSRDMNTAGNCLTGLKCALSSAGIINTNSDIQQSAPKTAINWFRNNPKQFQEVKYLDNGDGTVRELNTTDLKNLPAGYIVFWIPENSAEFADEKGHVGITNGNGQEYADETDNMQWDNYYGSKGSGKGEHGKFAVFKLADGWQLDPTSGKLVFKG